MTDNGSYVSPSGRVLRGEEYADQRIVLKNPDVIEPTLRKMVHALRDAFERDDVVPTSDPTAYVDPHEVTAPAEGPRNADGDPVMAWVVDPRRVRLRLTCTGRPRIPDVDGPRAA